VGPAGPAPRLGLVPRRPTPPPSPPKWPGCSRRAQYCTLGIDRRRLRQLDGVPAPRRGAARGVCRRAWRRIHRDGPPRGRKYHRQPTAEPSDGRLRRRMSPRARPARSAVRRRMPRGTPRRRQARESLPARAVRPSRRARAQAVAVTPRSSADGRLMPLPRDAHGRDRPSHRASPRSAARSRRVRLAARAPDSSQSFRLVEPSTSLPPFSGLVLATSSFEPESAFRG
jgi:hypothetical protein